MRSHATPWWRDDELDYPKNGDPEQDWRRMKSLWGCAGFEQILALGASGHPIAVSYDNGKTWDLNPLGTMMRARMAAYDLCDPMSINASSMDLWK